MLIKKQLQKQENEGHFPNHIQWTYAQDRGKVKIFSTNRWFLVTFVITEEHRGLHEPKWKLNHIMVSALIQQCTSNHVSQEMDTVLRHWRILFSPSLNEISLKAFQFPLHWVHVPRAALIANSISSVPWYVSSCYNLNSRHKKKQNKKHCSKWKGISPLICHSIIINSWIWILEYIHALRPN